jgi:PAS domain S-box-containing protein
VYTFIGFYSSKLQLTLRNKEKVEEDLDTTQGLLESFFENTPEGIAILDQQGKILRANKGFEKMVGTLESDAIGLNFKTIFRNHDNILEIFGEVLGGSNITDIEMIHQRENGDTINLLISLSNIQSKHTHNISAVIKDITEQKKYEHELQKTEELLRKSEKLAVVGELAAGVAHEIRNPLTTLKGFTQLLMLDLDQKRLSMLNLMKSELNRIEMITNEFMVIAKPQAINYKINNLKDIVSQVLSIMEPQATLQNIDINILFKNTEPYVQCDENQLKQVFINIIKNAFEAMPNGGNLTVEIYESDNGDIAISIKDTGEGIPEEIIPRLCEPFYTLKEKGTGLGLMVSYRILEAHKGKIEFSSDLKKGTTVTVKLPLQHAEVQV